ncbi:MAG: ketoacyl-ACP synthase III [Deltaproteobacteria bacterium]|nr:ketoacyl-ACP synthase III [Deltaproteobacteria bacterium]
MRRAIIVGTGSHLPEGVLTNADFEQMVDTSDKWIVERTGVRERHILTDEKLATSDMATAASAHALEMANMQPTDLDCIILATVTADMTCPSGAVRVQQKLGANNAFAFDVSAACAGSLLGLDIGATLIESGRIRNALVIGAESISRIVNYQDRNTCVLFGDAAGAMVLRAADETTRGVLAVVTHTDGRQWELIHVPAGGSALPGKKVTDPTLFTVHMSGREVFKFAVRALADLSHELMRRCQLVNTDIHWVVPHQANRRILEALSQKLAIPLERFIINIEHTGNTSSASVPMALDQGVRDGRIRQGEAVLMLAIGSGMAWSGAIVRW